MPYNENMTRKSRTEPERLALAYLAQHQVMTIATVGEDGVWAAAVFYAHEGFDLFFLSAGHTRHALHIHENPQVAATIQEDYAEWTAVKGIQLSGSVTQLHGEEKAVAINLYQKKYAFLTQAPLPIQMALKKVNWYRLCPDRLFFVDNSRRFGHRDTIL